MKIWIKMSSLCIVTVAAVIFCLVYWDEDNPDCNLILAAGFCLGIGFASFQRCLNIRKTIKKISETTKHPAVATGCFRF